LDIKLPDMDGVEVLKTIKKEAPDIEVVMITAYASLQSSVIAINEGAYAYVMKPFDVDNLANTVAGAAEKQRLILENKRLRRFNENIVQSLNEGILIEEEKAAITFVNPKIEEMFGYTKDEIIGKSLKTFVAPEYVNVIEGMRASEDVENRYEVEVVTKEGKIIPIIISAVPLIEKGKHKGILSVLTDISEIKKLEQELKEKIEELEQFNKLMIGRELRMVELKNRVKELEMKSK
ncbi:MAG: PAS domain S-box protein, partial [Candidatus Hydrothermarchaeales archaeon]